MRAISVAALATMLLCPVAALAQKATPFYLNGGPSFPLGDIDDGWSSGYAIGGGVAFDLRPNLDLRADVSYSRFGFDEEEVFARAGVPAGADVEIDGGSFGAFTALALLQWHLSPAGTPYRPYLLGGLGYWRESIGDLTVRSATDAETIDGHSDNGAAGALGAGFAIAFRPTLGFFLEGRYVIGWDFGDPPDLDSTYLPVKLGIVFNP